METWIPALGNLISLGGIGGSLAFLLLGYNLLRQELSRVTPAGHRSPPNQSAIDAIKHFIKMSLLFFLIGVAAQLLLSVQSVTVIRAVRDIYDQRVSRTAINDLDLDTTDIDPAKRNLVISFGSVRYDEDNYIPDSARDDYDLIIAFGPVSDQPDTSHHFPFATGPFEFPIAKPPNVVVHLEDKQLNAISGKCVKVVIFGVQKNSVKSPELEDGFDASTHSGAKLFRYATIGPNGSRC